MRKGIDCKGNEWEENFQKLKPEKDLTGQTFEKLSVLFRVQNDKQGNSRWLTSCECGNTLVARGTSLRSKHTCSCGCAQSLIVSEKLCHEFIPGERIGYWTVMHRANGYIGKGAYWHVKCRCGEERDIKAQQLRSRHSLSCGCMHRELVNNAIAIDLTGLKFGLLTVVSMSNQRINGSVCWNVICECGTEKCVSGLGLRQGTTVSCGCQNRSSGEVLIADLLKQHDILFKDQCIFPDLLSERNGLLRYDFGILKGDNIVRLIEFDGAQHFGPITKFGGEESFLRLQQNDALKNQYAISRNIPLVRIPYTKKKSLKIDDLLGDEYLIS